MSRDYKDEYDKFQKGKSKYRAKLNKYNRDKGTYGNGDGKDATHKDGKISGFEESSKNKGRKEKSRVKGSKRKLLEGGTITGLSHEEGGVPIEAEGGEFITSVEATNILGADKLKAANDNPEDYEIVRKMEYGGLVEKNAVNRSTVDILEYINEHGDLPMSDARNRSKK